MKLGDPILPLNPDTPYNQQLNRRLLDFFRVLVTKVNGIASGSISHRADNASSSMPTSGTWAKGDFVANSSPVEAGSASSKYVVIGWMRLTNGSTNVATTDWVECQTRTGN
jgi:hypothetical protein